MSEKPWLAHYDHDVPATLEYPPMALHEFLYQAARLYPDRAGVIFRGQPITYARLAAQVELLAGGLMRIGVRPGDVVGLMLPNLPQFLVAYYAVLQSGGVVAAINPNYHLGEMQTQMRDSGVSYLFALDSHLDMISRLPADVRPKRVIFTTIEEAAESASWQAGQTTARLSGDVLALKDLLTGAPDQGVRLPVVTPDQPAIFQYSGGTTGTPKAAVGLHRNLVANTLQFRAWLIGLEDGKEVFLTAIPLYHVYGMVIGMSVGIAMGATLALALDARDIPNLLRIIQEQKVTFFPGVPNLYHAINQHPDVVAGRYDLSSIKACISGSAPLLRHIKERFEALTGGKVVEGYGLSEAPTATHCNPVQGENRTGSIGLPLPDVDCRVVDLETGDRDMPPGESGELIIRSPQVMAGYHGMPAETALALRNGWLYTGDIARMDHDGYFYLIDRKKELINVGGFQVWPREVEEVIAQHPAVQEVGVAGVPHIDRGEVVKAWVVLKPGQEINAHDIRSWCREQLVGYKVPALVEFRGPLPRSNVGKLLHRELVRLHVEHQER